MRVLIDNIIRQLKEVQEAKNWMGANFVDKLNPITENEAFIRPLPSLHSVAEIVSHLTAWRRDAITKISTGKGKLTEDSAENWLDNDALRRIGWNAIMADHKNSLAELIDFLRAKDDNFLQQKYYDTDFKGDHEYQFVIEGILHHDIYHLGQLGIVIKLLRERGNP